MALQQLIYTYAARGLDGRAGFQPVGASEALRTAGRGLLQHVRSLCRFDRPASGKVDPDDVVSYGWLDVADARLAFRRVYTGFDPVFKRPGNFAAHVLVGPSAELPADVLLGLYASPSWWSGDLESVPDDGRLPTTALDAFERPAAAPSLDEQGDATALLAAVLSQRGRVELAESSQRLASALALVAQQLPDLVNHLSVSTYEAPGQGSRFHLVGLGPGAAGVKRQTLAALAELPALDLPRQAAAFALSPHAADRRAVQRAWASTATAQGRDLQRFTRLAATAAAAAKGDLCSVPDLLPGLEHPETALDLLEHRQVRRLIGGALAAGDADAWGAITRIGAGLPTEVQAAVGGDVGEASDVDSPDFILLARRMAQLPEPTFSGFAAEARRRVERQPNGVAAWPAPLVAAAVGLGARGCAPRIWTALVERGAQQLAEHAADGTVPASVWVAMCEQALARPEVDPRAVLPLFVGEPSLTRAAVKELSERQLRRLVVAATDADAGVLLGVQDFGKRPELYVDLLAERVPRLPVPEQTHLLALARTVLGRSLPPRLPPVLLDAVRARVAYDLRNPTARRSEAVARIAEGVREPQLECWARVLSAAFRQSGLGRTPELLPSLDPEDRRLAARYLLDAAAGRARTAQEVSNAVRRVADHGYSDVPELAKGLLVAGWHAASAGTQSVSAVAVLTYVADELVAQDHMKRNLSGRLKDDATHELARMLVTEMLRASTRNEARLLDTAKTKTGQAWIKSLVKSSG